MKVCPNCQTKYPDDANFCPQETCATPQGPRRLDPIAEGPAASRYELETQIGGARSGAVSRARDGQTGATVAHKLVARASLPTPAAVERAQRELKQLQRAQNSHLARVLDFGKDADGRLYVVSELVEGEPLDRFVAATGALPLDRTKAIIAQIGEALLEGQKVGVVHHDLAAKNVLVGANDQVKVINFVAPVAVSDTVFGVPEYLSPEQAEGKLVDQRSNTYSLGAIMTLMLTGQPPVSGPDAAAVLQQVQKGELAPPSRSAAGAGAGLTPEIDRVVLKAMDKSPNRRPLTMRQFLTDVSALVGLGMQPAGDRNVGFAKTMMFAGGSPEVQKLVNQALAARAEANANGAASTAPAAVGTPPIAVVAREQATPPPQAAPATPPPQVTPPPVAGALGPRRSHGAAIAATMVALPAASARIPGAGPAPGGHGDLDRAISPTPPPASMPTPPPASMATPPPAEGATPPPVVAGGAQPAPTPKQAAGGSFRETLWFKKGDVDQMVAEARARVEAARGKGPGDEPEAPVEDARPLEDRYVDDGTVTTEDRKKFSLRQGGTATALPTVGSVPGERMSEAEMVGEIGGRKRMVIIGGLVAVALAVVGVIALGFRGKNVAKSATAMAPVAAPASADPPAPPPPTPAPPAPAPAAAAPKPAPKPASAPAAVADDEGAAAPKPHAAASHRHASAKKAKASKKHH
jgi:serine/threonine-protein kinase